MTVRSGTNRRFEMLKSHILYLDAEELTPNLAMIEYLPGSAGVHVHLDNAPFPKTYNTLPHRYQPVSDDNFIKGFRINLGILETEKELGAIAELQFAVRAEGVEICFRCG